jgi:hypothetical protein
MLTVAEGGGDAHPAMRRNVILAKTELMKLVFMDLRFLIGFYRTEIISWSLVTLVGSC